MNYFNKYIVNDTNLNLGGKIEKILQHNNFPEMFEILIEKFPNEYPTIDVFKYIDEPENYNCNSEKQILYDNVVYLIYEFIKKYTTQKIFNMCASRCLKISSLYILDNFDNITITTAY